MTKDVNHIFQELTAGTVECTPEHEFKKLLESDKKLVIKFGADPTAPDLHLGHAVVLSKLKQFQDLGHHVVFLIGDFTARIGDPTGRSKTRPPLTEEQIAFNTKTYFDQVGRILDINKISIRFNSEWLKEINLASMIDICAKTTLARLTERDDFARRIKEHQSIGFHELLYPILQGYDSVALKSDIEFGGTDQTFNLLFGRFLQEQVGQKGQVIITTPLLEGLDGVEKMSKSLGNYIGLSESAHDAYGKLMSISDIMMYRYMSLLLHVTPQEIKLLQERVASGDAHPMTLKKQMAFDVVSKFWSADEAAQAQAQFETVFQQRDYSKATEVSLPASTPNPLWVVEFLKLLGAIKTTSEGKRLIEEKAVKIDGETISDFKYEVTFVSGMTVKVGKHRIYRIV
jgi:tyrosyl-tRNA synthetase